MKHNRAEMEGWGCGGEWCWAGVCGQISAVSRCDGWRWCLTRSSLFHTNISHGRSSFRSNLIILSHFIFYKLTMGTGELTVTSSIMKYYRGLKPFFSVCLQSPVSWYLCLFVFIWCLSAHHNITYYQQWATTKKMICRTNALNTSSGCSMCISTEF